MQQTPNIPRQAYGPVLGCCLLALTALLANRALAADYAETICATKGLLAYYRFEEASDAVADSSRLKHDGHCEGEVLHGVDSAFPGLGKAIRLTGTGYVRVPDLGKADAITVEMWVNQTGPATEGIAALYAADGWQPNFVHFIARKSGALELAVHGVSNFAGTDAEVVTAGRWLHLAASYDRTTGLQRLFQDGRILHESFAVPQVPLRLVEGAIGAWIRGVTSRPFIADVDEVAIYSAALPAGQLRSHYLAAQGKEFVAVDFVRDIRPILETRCLACHGPEKQESELRLDVRDSVLRGGESGEPAIAPFDSDGSQLIQRVASKAADHVMPPEGPPLESAEIAILRNWIDQGAVWPNEFAGHVESTKVATSHWSFQPVKKVAPPVQNDPFVTASNPLDAFVFEKLQAHGLSPSPPADPRTLVRRLYLDMHGLPPTGEELQLFIGDSSADAWGRLVDRVLASPRYGERWAAHWLDVIRYGDTHGFEVNTPRPNSWPYRDYVIKSLNDDKPYDRFIQEQLAGDQLGVDASTGFLVAAPALLSGQVGKDLASKRQARADELHEVIVSVGSGILGLTVGCARCHNHKFDPISQRDYYQLQAIFAGLRYGDRAIRNPDEVALAAPVVDASGNPESATAEAPNEMAAKVVFGGKFSPAEPSFRLYRGDPMQRRERVSPDVPAVFGSLSLESTTPEAQRREALAAWLVAPTNPLTARVVVNRLWQHHFGMGLVATPSDFGAMGRRPTHPELLDWLAATLVENRWSLKAMHRLILTSNTYRQASAARPECLAVDAGSQWLWRFPQRRLEMEPIRDSILFTSGALELKMGGPGFLLFKANDNYVRVYDPKEEWGPGDWRRMIYAHRVRMAQDGVFGAFDCPDAGQPAPVRSRSTTAIQALNLLNSGFIAQQADLLAQRAQREASCDQSAEAGDAIGVTGGLDCAIRRIFVLAYNRQPSESELAAARATAAEFGLPAVCRAVFNSNEFLFLP